ncbi:PAS domain S-box protein [Thermodesulfobacteriota bacterium]
MTKKPTHEELEQRVRELEKKLAESVDYSSSLLESLPIPMFVINDDTSIRYVNPAIERLTGYNSKEVIGKNAPFPWWIGGPNSGEINERITNIFRGVSRLERLFRKKNGKQFWVEINSIPIVRNGAFKYAVTTWLDVTERKQIEKALLERERELDNKAKSLEEINTALQVLLNKREEDRVEFKDKVIANIQELVLPYLEKLMDSSLDERQKAYLSILESNLGDITSPLSKTLSTKYFRLTPMEIQISNLIKKGRATKEIAGVFNVSVKTVESHRKNIRRKLGITNRKENLMTHLLSVQ